MFLKLTRLDGVRVLVNMDFVGLIAPNEIGRSQIGWRNPDLEIITVKETPDEILIALERGR